jgi:hypothetical protein
MSTKITNKTKKPLSVPLPRGKVLHLGPGKSGQIASNDAEHPPLKALVESGAVEVAADGRSQQTGASADTGAKASTQAHTPGSGSRRSGDR